MLSRFRRTTGSPTLHNSRFPTAAIQTFTDETGAPATLPEMGSGGEEGKLKVLLGLLKKCDIPERCWLWLMLLH